MNTIPEAIAAIAAGRFVVVVDDADRENEADLILAAEKATAENIAFMVKHTSGLICAPAAPERIDALGLPLMVEGNVESHDTAFTVSVDYRGNTTTGISAADRAATLRALADPGTQADDLARPGHIFPLRYCEGGVLVRPGHTEAAVDLAVAAGLAPVGVVCELVAPDGSMAKGADIERFVAEHHLPMISIADLIAYRLAVGDEAPIPIKRMMVEAAATARFPTRHGEFQIVGYEAGDNELVALIMGDVATEGVMVRVHSECVTGDALGSLRCDCRDQLHEAMDRIAEEGTGVVLYMRGHEGRGIGLLPKLAAYALQDQGLDTVEANEELGLPADGRDYAAAAAVLRDLGVLSVRLLTNNPAKQLALESRGVPVKERLPMRSVSTTDNERYLATKVSKMGHLIEDSP
ncbi:MAG: 3,4-dihydroxy-2-butanone-4-phosphate synthase [Acidimicrobiia bacterium]|nr:3,4-dihydroxy-2-butanone-4-phosphate synthase [Acidimicrobiia bacterium]